MLNAHSHINHIVEKLFAPEQRRLQKSVERLHKSNQEIKKQSLDGFMYRGRWFKSETSAAGAGLRTTIDILLWPEIDLHLAEETKTNLDRELIRQVIFRQIENAITLQDIRDQVPPCIEFALHPDVLQLPRRGNPDGWKTLSQLKQFNKALPLMQFYASTRLIY